MVNNANYQPSQYSLDSPDTFLIARNVARRSERFRPR